MRVDSHVYSGYVIPPYYDSMIGEAHLLRRHAQGRPGAGLPGPERVPGPGHQDDDPASQGDHGRPPVHRGQGDDRLHGGVPHADDSRAVLLTAAVRRDGEGKRRTTRQGPSS